MYYGDYEDGEFFAEDLDFKDEKQRKVSPGSGPAPPRNNVQSTHNKPYHSAADDGSTFENLQAQDSQNIDGIDNKNPSSSNVAGGRVKYQRRPYKRQKTD